MKRLVAARLVVASYHLACVRSTTEAVLYCVCWLFFTTSVLPRVVSAEQLGQNDVPEKLSCGRKNVSAKLIIASHSLDVQHIWSPHHKVAKVNMAHCHLSLNLVVVRMIVQKLKFSASVTQT